MGLTSALYTGLSGLNANQFRIDVIGDNIANVNTVGFKSTRSLFQTQFARNFSLGSSPGEREGGTNPMQIGLGSVLGAIQRDFSSGSIETTGMLTDLAIEGNGFFVLHSATGQEMYSRDGSFSLSADYSLVSADGFKVQGYGVDENFNIVPGQLQGLEIPLGALNLARATQNVTFDGNLNAAGDAATSGSVLLSQILSDGSGGPDATALTSLTNLYDGTTQLYSNGDVITVTGVEKGGRELGETTFTVGVDGTTLGDFIAFLDESLGIQSGGSIPGSPGITIVNGQIVVEGNYGSDNEIVIGPSDIVSSGTVQQPFAFQYDATATNGGHADGESVTTNFILYDSLGSPVRVSLTMVLEQKATGGNTWRFYMESPDDSDIDLAIGTGIVAYDTDGRVLSSTGTQLSINRAGTGAADPMGFDIDLSNISSLADEFSTLVQTTQDGFAAGTLSAFAISEDGQIVGTFTNGLTRILGQVALATFTNPAGLSSITNNAFITGPNSGNPVITAPMSLGAGRVLSGALELSNVDLSKQFIGLITASTGFSAASRIITTSDELLQELLLMTR